MEGLRARLEAQKIADQAVVPELNEATWPKFQGRERLPHWMRDTLGALRQYMVAVPRPARPAEVGGDVASQAGPGDTLAYRMWACLQQSHQAYRSRYTAAECGGQRHAGQAPMGGSVGAWRSTVHLPRSEFLDPGGCAEVGCQQWQSYSRVCQAFRRLPTLPRLPIPVFMRTDPSLAAKGLGRLGAYEIPVDLWHGIVPRDFVERAMQYNVEEDPEGGAGKIGPGVEPIVATLDEAQVLKPDTSPPSAFPFILPKSSAKVSLILYFVGMNE